MSTTRTFEVTAVDTALALGSGDVDVLGTPRLLAWMEAVTLAESALYLRAGQTSVGVAVRLRHRRPTAVGGTVTVTAGVSDEEERRLMFEVTARDQHDETVASAHIERELVARGDFG